MSMNNELRTAKQTLPQPTKRVQEAKKLLDRVDAYLYPDNEVTPTSRKDTDK